MSAFAAFLRGVNLGDRTMKSADLCAAFEAMGFSGARTLLASGNVVFEAEPDPHLARRIEAGLLAAFGFEVGVVLRTRSALRAMVAANPFASVPAGADAKLYVVLLGPPIGERLKLPFGVAGDFDVVGANASDIFAVAWHMPNGRYGAGLDQLGRQFPKGTLLTTRNWNTIIKAAG